MQQRCKHAVVTAAYALVKMSSGSANGMSWIDTSHDVADDLLARQSLLPPTRRGRDTRQNGRHRERFLGRWQPSAHNDFNIGIAIAIQHPDFYYSMAGFDNPTCPNDAE